MNQAKEKIKEIRSHDDEGSTSPKSFKRSKYDTEENDVKNNTANVAAHSNKRIRESPTPEVCNDNTVLVAKHYNLLQNKDLTSRGKSRILYMRNFNNWIKSVLISEYINKLKQSYGSHLKVLDMCCGKGGDLLKWKMADIGYLICTDLADVTMQHCQDRYNDLKRRNSHDRNCLFRAEFITSDCTKDHLRKKFKDPSISLDLVSCQFAFHYCFESLQQAECMMKNASECLKPGGYFIGTIPDAYDLVSRWQKCDGNNFGNEVYNVQFFCDKTKPPLFGAKYHFQLEGVVNCPEFLVYLPVFRKLASKFGLELKLFERFDSFYERMKDKNKSLIIKMMGLETYPAHSNTLLVGDPERDYKHAKQYMQNASELREIGTLSQSEWEVASLYAVFAFEKVKTGTKTENQNT